MSGSSLHAGGTPDGQAGTWRYVGVITVEVIVLAGIWLVQRYFGT